MNDDGNGRFERAVLLGVPTPEAPPAEPRRSPTWGEVPWRTIVGATGVVLGTYVLVQVVLATVQLLTLVVIAGFFAIVLAPATRRVQARLGGRRNLATGIVVFSTLTTVMGLFSLFLLPVRTQLINIVDRSTRDGGRRCIRSRARRPPGHPAAPERAGEGPPR